MDKTRHNLRNAKRIVVKVGTSSLIYDSGNINFARIEKLTRVLSDLMNQGKEVVLVSSGAIGVGVGKLKLTERPRTIREKQAVAAVGQCELMHIYSKIFSEYNHTVGQILLTKDIIKSKVGRLNVLNTFETLLEKGILPIVNENDSISIFEIRAGENDTFSENDTLAAIVSKIISADLLIILSDISGFYDSDPRTHLNASMFSVVEHITPQIEQYAGGVSTKKGTGGMVTKLLAAKIATSSGVNMVLAAGDDPNIITEIISGKEVGTLFVASKNK